MNFGSKIQSCRGLLKTSNLRILVRRSCYNNKNSNSKLYTSNINFPSFKVHGSKNFGYLFTNQPNMKVIKSIVLNRDPNKVTKYDGNELLEGAIYAVEAVTNILASNKDLSSSELSHLLTPKCYENIIRKFSDDARFQKG